MYADYNIDPENDIVYQNIIGRSLGDLYSDMNGSTSGGEVTFPTFNENATIKYTENDVDKFWLLSYKEAYNLIGSADAVRIWPSGSANYYWLRSPWSTMPGNGYAVTDNGYIVTPSVFVDTNAARPAFKCLI